MTDAFLWLKTKVCCPVPIYYEEVTSQNSGSGISILRRDVYTTTGLQILHSSGKYTYTSALKLSGSIWETLLCAVPKRSKAL